MWHIFLEGGGPANDFMTDHWRNKIVELYMEDNLKLSQDYHLTLKDYGYPVP
jgi:hypothetical protein